MSDEHTDRPSRLSTVAVLPWTVALLLFVVLAGAVVLVALGFSGHPLVTPEMAEHAPPAHTESPEPPSAPDPPAPEHQQAEPEHPEPQPAETPQPEVAHTPEPPVPPHDTSEPHGAAQPQPAGEHTAPAAYEPNTAPAPAEALHEAAETPTPEPEPQAAEPAASQPEPQVAAAPPPPPQPPVLRSAPDALAPAPDPALIEPSPQGPLPKIDAAGREPWQVYARPSKRGDDRPKVAVILSGLGLSGAATDAAIQGLPGEVTLAFQPFADNIQQWISLARAAGHEVLLNLPMEPVGFPANEPGPRALFASLSPEENQDRLRWALSRVSGYVGVVNHMGSRFTVSREAMQPVLAELKARGLLFVDARSAARSVATVMASEMQVPRAINDRFLDNREVSRTTVDARLAEVEEIARETGVSIAIGQAFPVTIERIREWSDTLSGKGIVLVPVSAVVDRQPDR